MNLSRRVFQSFVKFMTELVATYSHMSAVCILYSSVLNINVVSLLLNCLDGTRFSQLTSGPVLSQGPHFRNCTQSHEE